MRAIAIMTAVLVTGCTGSGTAATPSPSRTSPTAPVQSTATATCKLPVYWEAISGNEIRTAFVSVPDGAVSQLTAPPALPDVFGAVFNAATNTWLGVDRSQLSPDGTRYVYWKESPGLWELHVVEVATRADRTVYSGSELFIPIAFTSDVIYLVHGINLKQGAYELLFTLDPAGGGTPTLVPGSDRHMYQYGWVLISAGAAWGIDVRVQGTDDYWSVLRLDLSTSHVTQWFEGPVNDVIWPLGIDLTQRLYIQGVNQNNLWGLAAPGQAEELANPGPISLGDNVAGPTGMVSDSLGTWFGGRGGVWLYAHGAAPKQFSAGQSTEDVFPAGPCV